MIFFILIATVCIFIPVNGQSATTGNETTDPTIEALIQKANDLFMRFTMEQTEISSDVLTDFMYTKYEAFLAKLELIACKLTNNLIVAKTGILRQIDDSKNYMKETYHNSIIELCSMTSKIDIALYIDPEIESGIETELMHYKNALSLLQTNAYALFSTSEYYTMHSDEIYGNDVNIQSLQIYISSLETWLMSVKYDIKYKAQNFMYKLEKYVYAFESRAEEKNQHYQTILENVVMKFSTCVYKYEL